MRKCIIESEVFASMHGNNTFYNWELQTHLSVSNIFFKINPCPDMPGYIRG